MGWGDGCEGEVKIVGWAGQGNLHFQENVHRESQRVSETPGWVACIWNKPEFVVLYTSFTFFNKAIFFSIWQSKLSAEKGQHIQPSWCKSVKIYKINLGNPYFLTAL